MKSKFFILVLFLLFNQLLNGQNNSKASVILRQLNNDTLEYMKQEIVGKKNSFIGKTLSELLSEFPLPVVRYLNSDVPRDRTICPATTLLFYSYSQEQSKLYQRKNPLTIVITWAVPLKYEEMTDLKLGQWGGDWTSSAFDFFKDKIVGNIEMVRYDFRP